MACKRWDVLAELIKQFDLRFGAEIGTKAGRNILGVLRLCPDFHWIAVDPWEPTEHYRRWPEESFTLDEARFDDMARRYPGRIQKMKMFSHEAAPFIDNASLDLVFIDGDHSYDGIRQDIDLWLPKVRWGGVIAGHDYDNMNKYGEAFKGVDRAVQETFGSAFQLAADHVWWTRL